jgi:transporter family-2 protein
VSEAAPSAGTRTLIAAPIAVVVGATISVQSRINGELSHASGSSLLAAWWTMASGLVLLSIAMLVDPRARRGLRAIRDGVVTRRLPVWTLTGGIFGGTFLVCQSLVVPLTGVAIFVVGSIAGQTTSSLLVDRLGISASGVRPVSVARVIGALIAVAAVAVGVSGRSQEGTLSLGLAALAFLAGSCVAPQQAVNGRTAVLGRSPIASAFVNFVGGMLMLSTALVVMLASGALRIVPLYEPPWWALLGGICGAALVGMSAFVVPTLGLLIFSLLSVAGQLASGFLIDLLAPTVGASVGLRLALGLLLAMAAILVASAPQWERHVRRRRLAR